MSVNKSKDERTPAAFRRRRLALGLSQVKLAAVFDVAKLTVKRWEKGTRSDARPAPIPAVVWLALETLEHRKAATGRLDSD